MRPKKPKVVSALPHRRQFFCAAGMAAMGYTRQWLVAAPGTRDHGPAKGPPALHRIVDERRPQPARYLRSQAEACQRR